DPAPEGDHTAGRVDDGEGADGGGEAAVRDSGSVRAGRARAGHRDVGQRAEVVQCVALRVEIARKVAVPDAAADRHRRTVAIDVQHRVQAGARHLVAPRAGDGGERVRGAELR